MPKHTSKEFDRLIKLAVVRGLRVTFKKGKYAIYHPNGKDLYIFHKADRAVPILREYINKSLTYKENIIKFI
jgi:hypothetical protein